jgi:hypothetical protein
MAVLGFAFSVLRFGFASKADLDIAPRKTQNSKLIIR